MIPLKKELPEAKRNPLGMRVPTSLVAKNGSVLVADLGVTIGSTPVNVFKLLDEQKVYRSKNLKFAIDSGILVDANKHKPKLKQEAQKATGNKKKPTTTDEEIEKVN